MSRAVTADHILYDESIKIFRKQQDDSFNALPQEKSKSFILTSFEITEIWDLNICKIHPTIEISLPGPNRSFISEIENPEWVGSHNSHLFGIAISSIVSFLTHKLCKSTRDDYLSIKSKISIEELYELALNHPILTAGPGSFFTRLTKENEIKIRNEIKDFITSLFKIDYNVYINIMQTVRLMHLSLMNKREDFGLSYFLAVASIESIAQKVITRNKVKAKNELDNKWQIKSENDEDFAALYKAYKESRGNNQYIKERYIKFIKLYSPFEKWEEYVKHPYSELYDSVKEIHNDYDNQRLLTKNWFEKYPSDLSDAELESILSDSYKYRSFFVHQGQQPPHNDPNPSYYRFFQECRSYQNGKYEDKVLPNYELIISISKFSLLNYIKEITIK